MNPFSTSLVNSSRGWQPITSSGSLPRHHVRDHQGLVSTGTSPANNSGSQPPRASDPRDHTQPLGVPDRDCRPPPPPASIVFRPACDNCIQENVDCDIGRPECKVCYKKGLECLSTILCRGDMLGMGCLVHNEVCERGVHYHRAKRLGM